MIGYDESGGCVATVEFEYPDEGDTPAPRVRDQWVEAPLMRKCQQRFAVVPSGDVMTMPLLDKRLEVLRYALREAVEGMDIPAILQLARKAHETEKRIAAEQLADATPGGRERCGDIVIEDDAARGKVSIFFPAFVDRRTRRWLKICGFFGSGDGVTWWRRRTFRRDENIALENARYCVARILDDRARLTAAETAAE